MFEGRRTLYLQLTLFAMAIGLLLLLSRFFPLIDLIDAVQQRVMHWGAWSAICYPLLFAVSNVLLLPGGLLSVGSGFFFGLWWGFFIVLLGNSIAAAISFSLPLCLANQWLNPKLSHTSTLRLLYPALQHV